MVAVVCLLRAVNVGGHNQIKMDALRRLCESLKLRDVRTYVQSGNVVFWTSEHDLAALARRIGDAIERSHGFRPEIVLRTADELRQVIANNPFAGRKDIEPSKLAVAFLAAEPSQEARAAAAEIPIGPEELHIAVRELYIYYPNGMGRTKFPTARLDKALKTTGTARNWNTVTKLLEMADAED